jgi:hypothetical protein
MVEMTGALVMVARCELEANHGSQVWRTTACAVG